MHNVLSRAMAKSLRGKLLTGVSLVTLAGTLLAPAQGLPGTTQVAHAASLQVEMKGYKFVQNPLNIAVGDTVTWTNRDPESHNIAILEGPELNVSPEQKTGQSWSMRFTVPGRYHYYCEFHPNMIADVIVGGNNSTASTEYTAQTFKETGKSVRGKFLTYWNKNGSLAQQGYPISEEMQEKSPTDGKFYTVQYFERAVFEMHPENQAPNDVLLSLLGNFRYKDKYGTAGAPGQKASTAAGAQKFSQTGHTVGGKFLDYWNKNGGLAQQGYPISEEFQEKSDLDGKTYTVQYFERAVFELHSENKAPYDVLLSQLGKFRYDTAAKPNATQTGVVQQIGISANPEHYPLLGGPHAAPGVNLSIYQNDPQPTIGWVDELGTKWALHQLSWYQIETEPGVYHWEKVDAAINSLYNDGVKIILHPVHSPPWEWTDAGKVGYPKNTDDFKKFLTAAVQRYKGKVAAYQIWNEPNLAIESGKFVIAARYAEILKAGYTSVKSADPNAVVILAALTPTGVNDPYKAVDDVIFLRRLYAYNNGELKGYFDVLGAHPGSNANPPNTMYPDNPGPGPGWNTNASFYFRRIEQLRQVMIENGDAAKQMWLTEFGWASTTTPTAGFEYAAQTSEQKQADYIGQAFRMGRDNYPWLGPMMVFQLNMALPNVATEASDERIAWGLLRRDGTKRPSYFAVQQYAKEYNAAK